WLCYDPESPATLAGSYETWLSLVPTLSQTSVFPRPVVIRVSRKRGQSSTIGHTLGSRFKGFPSVEVSWACPRDRLTLVRRSSTLGVQSVSLPWFIWLGLVATIAFGGRTLVFPVSPIFRRCALCFAQRWIERVEDSAAPLSWIFPSSNSRYRDSGRKVPWFLNLLSSSRFR